ncbi:MAG TPA: hypothetical protein PLW86_19580 [Rhodocyclaceae bacterium]|nr:hypothetical protein [Rhodocyclaceae bacterium]
MNKLLISIKMWIASTISRAVIRLFSTLVSTLLIQPRPAPIPARTRQPHPRRILEGEFRRIDDANRW